MPSRFLLGLLDAHWSGGLSDDGGAGLGAIEREYSWVSGGQVVAFCAANRSYGGGRVLWVRATELRKALAKNGFAMWAWTLMEKIYWTGDEPSSDRTDAFAAVRLAPGPVTVWGLTVEREQGRHRGSGGRRMRVLAERADGIGEVPMPMPKPPRPSPKLASTLAKERRTELPLPAALIDELERLEGLAQGYK